MKSVKDILEGRELFPGEDSGAKQVNPQKAGREQKVEPQTKPQIEPQTESLEYREEPVEYREEPAEPIICAVCQDRGIILDGEVARPCGCMQMRKAQNQLRHARISKELTKCRFDRFRPDYYASEKGDKSHREVAQRALDAARGFVEEYKASRNALGLMFTGQVGSGKTFLAAAIANELTEADYQVLFIVVPDLLDELRASYKSDTNELDLLDAARTIPVLILDDLGAHNYSDWVRNRIYSIINYRLNESLPTIITTNLSLDEMEELLGVRTTSRIIQITRIFRLTVEKDIRHQIYHSREGKQ